MTKPVSALKTTAQELAEEYAKERTNHLSRPDEKRLWAEEYRRSFLAGYSARDEEITAMENVADKLAEALEYVALYSEWVPRREMLTAERALGKYRNLK